MKKIDKLYQKNKFVTGDKTKDNRMYVLDSDYIELYSAMIKKSKQIHDFIDGLK